MTKVSCPSNFITSTDVSKEKGTTIFFLSKINLSGFELELLATELVTGRCRPTTDEDVYVRICVRPTTLSGQK